MRTRNPFPLVPLLALGLALGAGPVHAQFDRGQESESRGWAPVSIGVRGGYDNAQRGWITGGFVGIPLLPNGLVELLPNFDVTFLQGFEEYQTNFELVYLSGDRQGGIVVGGGIGFRNSVFGPDPEAERRNAMTFSIVLGGRLPAIADRVRPQLEARWILQDEWTRDPRQVSVGVGFALW